MICVDVFRLKFVKIKEWYLYGLLFSIGVVVNNAILLIHQKQLEHKAGIRGLRCWIRIFQQRLRTILITTSTTIAGLLPMMIFGTDTFWEALAVIVDLGTIV